MATTALMPRTMSAANVTKSPKLCIKSDIEILNYSNSVVPHQLA
jgi:hypothetical protein